MTDALDEASFRERSRRRRHSLRTRSPPGTDDEVADVVADPLSVHDRGPTAKGWSTQRGEYLSVELGLGVSHGWSQPGAAGTTKVGAPCRHHVTRLAIRIQQCYLSDPGH